MPQVLPPAASTDRLGLIRDIRPGLVCAAVLIVAVIGQVNWLSAQTGPGTRSSDAITVVARVGKTELLLGEVHRYLQRFPMLDAQDRKEYEPSALESLIQRELVLRYLLQRTSLVSQQEIDQVMQQRRLALASRNEILATVCAEQGIDEATLERAVAWNLVWPRFLARQLTPEKLRQYFERHQAHFDGRRVHVSQILWRLDFADEPSTVASAQQRFVAEARALRARILAGELDFAEAAKRHSQAPSAANGGDLGVIDREGPMTEQFSRTAFDLELQEISSPMVDSFGVHLILCRQIEPGRRKFAAVRADVERSARRDLFLNIAQRQRRTAKIEYPGAIVPLKAGAASLERDTILHDVQPDAPAEDTPQ